MRLSRLITARTYFRIQPKGKPLPLHSRDIDGKPVDGIFVFKSTEEMADTVGLWRPSELTGTEVVEIEYSGVEKEHDLENGTLIDPAKARITRRRSLKEYL